MKVAELRAQGWTAIQGDVLTNNLSERIVLSFNGAFAVNNGHHDELEIVDLLWRNDNDQECEFSGITDHSLDGWRPYFGPLSNADKPAIAIDEKPVFTQAMADTYKMPPVGSWFTLHYHEHDSIFNDMNGHDFEVIGINDDVYTFRNDTKGFGALKLNPINCQPIDNRTEKQKQIDEIAILIENDNRVCEVSDEHTKIIIKALLMAGLMI